MMETPALEEVPETFFDVLATVRGRPGLFFERPSVDQLQAFLIGYESALARSRRILRGVQEFDAFQTWIAAKLEFPKGPMGWSSMLRCRYPDEHQAFSRFFDLMDDFCRQRHIAVNPLQRGPR